MIQCLVWAVTPNGNSGTGHAHAVAPEEIPDALSQPQNRVWVDVVSPTGEDLRWLEQTFHLHPLAIEDLRSNLQRGKVEDYEQYLYIVMHALDLHNDEVVGEEVDFVLGNNYLITERVDDVEAIAHLWGEYTERKRKPERGTDFLLHRLADRVVDAAFPVFDVLEDRIDAIEDDVVENPGRQTMARLMSLKRQLVLLRKVLGPQRDVMNSLMNWGHPCISHQAIIYFRDIYDHLVRLVETVETQRDLTSNAMDAYLSQVSNNLNEVMRRLTVITTVGMPLTVLTGFFGMNFQHLPFDRLEVLIAAFLLMLAVPTAMLVWFRRNGWI
ncbi:MAG: magnesium/cobalt transporter CorA [Anaerolineae bacterium]|nr:magnesium/cobalt transporter CorA [Anaerolineae bacterium]